MHSRRLVSDFGDGKVALNAPSIIDYEMGSVLYKLVRHKIIEYEYAREAFGKLLNLPIARVAPISLVSALDLSNDLSIHYYDCLYILAAKESRSALVSSDQKMLNAAKKVLPADAAVHIKDIEGI